jgi:protein-S-isoprenylcysteine O-methyltransferase Ste14
MALIGKIAYGALFCFVLPALLILWARGTASAVTLPAYGNPWLGAALTGSGLVLLATGMAALWRRGGGLPMNAWPPPRLVDSGVFATFPHPIYTGFCLMTFGVAMVARSASGLWLVGPAVALGCAALVYGYERPDLLRRFGGEALKRIRVARPDAVRFYLFVLLPWLAIYEAIATIGVQRGSLDTRLPFEARLPVWPWTEPIYASIYLIAILAPWLARTKWDLRTLMVRSWLAMATVFPVYLFLPTHAPFRPFDGGGPLGALMRFERALDVPAEALPSFHVIWAVLAACSIGSRWAKVWAAAVSVSCVTNGMHSIADVAAGGLWSWGLLRYDRIWDWLRDRTERIANSWREWRIGRFRLINHALYGGLATFACLSIVTSLTDDLLSVAITAAAGLVGAALWAQGVEGSPRLMRPFGFYGGLFSVILAGCLAPDPWRMLAAYSVAGPWLQAIGRLRCLVQGCCHGAPADPRIGIRYHHPRSRVLRIAGLAGRPVHATPLYSITCNAFTALVLARLWMIGAPMSLIGGLWLLNGLGRFVEEAYRGEPQTPVIGGLRMYQWIAIGTVVAGAAITTIPTAPSPGAHVTLAGIVLALIFGVVAGLALGFDAPECNHRFGRLT